jgi:hypothetical protein
MKKMAYASLVAILVMLVLAPVPPATSTTSWELSNVTLTDGGYIAGTFTLDILPLDWTLRTYNYNIVVKWYPYWSTTGETIIINPIGYYSWTGASANRAGLPDVGISFFSYSTWTDTFSRTDMCFYFLPSDATPGTIVPLYGGLVSSVAPNDPRHEPGYTVSIIQGEFIAIAPVPEPCHLLLLGPGLAGLWVWGRKKFKCI